MAGSRRVEKPFTKKGTVTWKQVKNMGELLQQFSLKEGSNNKLG